MCWSSCSTCQCSAQSPESNLTNVSLRIHWQLSRSFQARQGRQPRWKSALGYFTEFESTNSVYTPYRRMVTKWWNNSLYWTALNFVRKEANYEPENKGKNYPFQNGQKYIIRSNDRKYVIRDTFRQKWMHRTPHKMKSLFLSTLKSDWIAIKF